jgi:purine-nucleoside phosphorylase
MKPIDASILRVSEEELRRELNSQLCGEISHFDLSIVLGSGWGDAIGEFSSKAVVKYSSIPALDFEMNAGHAGEIRVIEKNGKFVLVFFGRVHYYQRQEATPLVAPTFLSHRLGVRDMLLTNAAGGINPSFRVGDLIVIKDHDSLIPSVLLGLDKEIASLGFDRHVSMSDCYDRGLIDLLLSATTGLGQNKIEGIYQARTGPEYETPFQIAVLAGLGVDLVGMSTVPDVLAAKSLSKANDPFRVAALSCVTNMAASHGSVISHEEVTGVLKSSADKAGGVLRHFIEGFFGS